MSNFLKLVTGLLSYKISFSLGNVHEEVRGQENDPLQTTLKRLKKIRHKYAYSRLHMDMYVFNVHPYIENNFLKDKM